MEKFSDDINVERPFRFNDNEDNDQKHSTESTGVVFTDEVAAESEPSSCSTYDAFAHELTTEFPDGGLQAWTVVFGSWVGLMPVLGIINTISSIHLYISKHQLAHDKVGSISWIFSLYTFLNLAIGIVAGAAFDVYGIKVVLLVGMILNCGGLYATAFSTKLWHFILSFGVCAGIGSGITLVPLVSVISHWFLKRRGLANGIAKSGSIAGVFFPMMLRSLFPQIGFKKTMVILASIAVFLSTISFFTVKDRSAVLNSETSHIPKGKRLVEAYKHILNYQTFKQKDYLFLVIGMFFSEFSAMLVITYIASYGATRHLNSSTTYIIVTVMNASGIVGKVLPNYLSDKFGRFNMMIVIMVMMIIALFAIWLPYYNLAGFYLFAIAFGFTFGGIYALTPVVLSQISQTKELGSRYATAYFFVSFSNLISIPVGSHLINQQTISHYNHMIIFSGCALIVATLFIILSRMTLVGWKVRSYV